MNILSADDVKRPTLNPVSNGASPRRLLRRGLAFRCLMMLTVAVMLLAFMGCCTIGHHKSRHLHAGKRQVWQRAASAEPLTLRVIQPAKATGNEPLPVVFYLHNLAAKRAGWENDASIISDFRSEGYLVVMVDFARHTNARMPFIARDLGKLRDDVRAKKLLGEFNVDMAHVFIVPAGCRLKRNVVFYRDEGRTLAMDIIYPSKPKRPAGTVLEFSCDNKDRFGNFSLSVCSDALLDGFATEGLAVAMADHPVAPPYKGFDAMPDCAWKIKAAVRTLRVESQKLGMNGKIAPVGFSRGSGMALMLVTTAGMAEFEDHGENTGVSSDVQGAVVMSGRFTYLDLLPEDKMLARYVKAWGEREANMETWRRHGALDYLKPLAPALPMNRSAGVPPALGIRTRKAGEDAGAPPGSGEQIAAFGGSWNLSPSDGERVAEGRVRRIPPLFLTINCTESPDALHQMEVLRKRVRELGGEAEFHMDNEPRGHKVTLVPEILEAMNDYLKQRVK